MGEAEEPISKKSKTDCIKSADTSTQDNIDTLTISRICARCRLDFVDEHQLRCHFLRFRNQSSFQCELCHKSYIRADILQEHQRVHLCESLYKCVKCFYSCNQIYDIYEHMHTVHKINIEHIFKCPYDDMMFRDKATLFQHIGCHRIKHSTQAEANSSEEKNGAASAATLHDTSDLSSSKKERLSTEEQNEEEEEVDDILPSTLLECNLDAVLNEAKQVLQMSLNKHNQNETAGEKTRVENPVEKPDCALEDEVLDEIDKSTLIDLDYVKNDMVINTENLHTSMTETDSSVRMLAYFKNIKCAYCTKMFIMKNDLKNHLVVDHDLSKIALNDDIVSQFECTQCSLKFYFAIDLTHHNTKEHTELKCSTCNKVYHQLHNLKKHEKTCMASPPKEKSPRVTKPLSIMCEICDKTFKRNWNLKQHMQKIHKITHNP